MEDGSQIVRCAATVEFLDAIAKKNGVGMKHHRTIFSMYRDEIERLASAKFDAGSERPLLTVYDVPS